MNNYTKVGLSPMDTARVAHNAGDLIVKNLKKVARHVGIRASEYNHIPKEDLVNRIRFLIATRGLSMHEVNNCVEGFGPCHWTDVASEVVREAYVKEQNHDVMSCVLGPNIKHLGYDAYVCNDDEKQSVIRDPSNDWASLHAYRILIQTYRLSYGLDTANFASEMLIRQCGFNSAADFEDHLLKYGFTFGHFKIAQAYAAHHLNADPETYWRPMERIPVVMKDGSTTPVLVSSFRRLRSVMLSAPAKGSPLFNREVTPQPWLDFVYGEPTPKPKPEPKPERPQTPPPPPGPRPEAIELTPEFKPAPKETPVEGLGLEGALQTMIRDAIGDKVEESLTERGLTAESVEAVVEKCISKIPDMPRVVTPPDGDRPQLVHPSFEAMMQVIAVGEIPYLFGPSGSGKTHGAGQFADMVQREHTIIPCNEEMTVTDLIGYRDMRGEYVESAFYRAFVGGHLITMDEADKAPGPVLVTLNSAIAQRVMMFPTGTQTAPDETTFLFTGNTRMSGASATYSAGQRQDTSLTNRLVNVAWNYDARLETALTKAACESFDGDWAKCRSWLEEVIRVRSQIEKMGLSYVAGPRQSIAGARLLSIGVALETVREQTMFGWMRPEDAKRIRKEVYSS